MKLIQYTLAIFCLCLVVACGSTSDSSTSTTGTVTLTGGSAAISTSLSSPMYATTTGAINHIYVRPYVVSLGAEDDCTEVDTWYPVINDGVADISDCTTALTSAAASADSSGFFDMTGSPEMGSASVPGDTSYACIKVTMCDQLVWTTADEDLSVNCSGDNVEDVYNAHSGGTDDTAEITTYYWSSGDTATTGDDSGSAATPMVLADAVTVTGGGTTALLFTFTNVPTTGGWVGTYLPEGEAEEGSEIPEGCGISAPTMSITEVTE